MSAGDVDIQAITQSRPFPQEGKTNHQCSCEHIIQSLTPRK